MKSSEEKIKSNKDKYVEKRKTEIDNWNIQLKELEAKIVAAASDNKANLEHKEHVAALRQKRDEAKVKLAEIQSAGDDMWDGLKDGMDNLWMSIKDGFENVKARF